MAKSRMVFVFVFYITSIFIASHVIFGTMEAFEDEAENLQESLESLGNLFKIMSGTDCKMSCPEGSVPLSRRGHISTSNGCGSLGIKLDTSMFPGFEQCCDAHDKCYDTCNEDRDECDAVFKGCLHKVCDEMKTLTSPDQVQVCENTGSVMHATAVGLGCTAFKQAQSNACVCSEQTDKEIANSKKDSYGRGVQIEL